MRLTTKLCLVIQKEAEREDAERLTALEISHRPSSDSRGRAQGFAHGIGSGARKINVPV